MSMPGSGGTQDNISSFHNRGYMDNADFFDPPDRANVKVPLHFPLPHV